MKRYLLVILFLAACTSTRHKNEEPTMSPTEKLNKGIRHLEKTEYSEALNYFEQYLTQTPVSDSTLSATFYSGLALEGLGRFEEAEQKFKTSQRLAEGHDAYMEAESLFQVAKSYEGQGNDTKALAAYLDTVSRAKPLRRETAEVELPARIAAIYMRQGEPETADKYYKKAEAALNKLRGKGPAPEWFPRSLYSMGKMSPRSLMVSDFDSGLKSMRRSQNYLLRSIESQHPVWAKKSEEELESIYNSAWKAIETYPIEEAEDHLMALKNQQAKMIEMGLVLNGVLLELKQDVVPGSEENNSSLRKLQGFISGYEKRLEALLVTRPVNEGLTPEAQKLESIEREGVVVDPSGVLEQQKKTKVRRK